MSKGKVIWGVFLAVVAAGGLYLLNRYWIVPAATRRVQAGNGNHPLAPEFSLQDLSGRKLSLADYKGKVVMLDFWATWCGPCRIEIPGFVQLQDRYRDRGFQIIGVSMDDGPEPVLSFYKEFKMNYPVVMGDQQLAETYGGILGLPTTFLIGRDGRVYAKHVGASDVSVFEEEIKKLLDAKPGEELARFTPVGRAAASKIEMGDPAEVNSEVPGINLTKLNATQIAEFKKRLSHEQCPCGCNLTVLNCRVKDRACAVSLKIARQELEKMVKPGAPGKTARLVGASSSAGRALS